MLFIQDVERFVLLIVVLWGLLPSNAIANSADLSILRNVTVEHPFCEGQTDLNVGREAFVPLKNKAPGIEKYNELVGIYQDRKWVEFDSKYENFLQLNESSPLREPAAYLKAQFEFEKSELLENPKIGALIKAFRELSLLYPKSYYHPAIIATVGNFWLRRKELYKALAVYERGLREYPKHKYFCIFHMGAGETQMRMKHPVEAKKHFNYVKKNCFNRRLQVGAKIRLADMLWKTKKAEAEKLYDAIAGRAGATISKFYPSTHANIAELKFLAKKYKSAKFYIEEYLRHGSRDRQCVSYSRKRLADIAYRQKRPDREVIGLYLEVNERLPNTDAGAFSYMHALFLGSKDVSQVEFRRRLRIFDETVDIIKYEELRQVAYLEKGLVSLAKNEKSAFDYLIRLQEKSDLNLKTGPIANFISKNLVETLIENARNANLDKAPRKTPRKNVEKQFLDSVENAYRFWLEGTEREFQSKKLVTEIIMNKFMEVLLSKDKNLAFEVLERGMKLKLWTNAGVTTATKKKIEQVLLRSLMDSKKKKSAAKLYLSRKDQIRSLIGDRVGWIYFAVAYEIDNKRDLESQFRQKFVGRRPASISKTYPLEIRDYLWWTVGHAAAYAREFKIAYSAFGKIKGKRFLGQAHKELFKLYRSRQEHRKAYKVGIKVYENAKEGKEKIAVLNELVKVVQNGELTEEAVKIPILARKLNLKDQQLAPYFYVAGLALFEKAKCKLSSRQLELALKYDDSLEQSPEARYKLGKCFMKQGKKARALLEWQKVASDKSEFWAGLAKNEMKLLDNE